MCCIDETYLQRGQIQGTEIRRAGKQKHGIFRVSLFNSPPDEGKFHRPYGLFFLSFITAA
jgi:hypothetical protein